MCMYLWIGRYHCLYWFYIYVYGYVHVFAYIYILYMSCILVKLVCVDWSMKLHCLKVRSLVTLLAGFSYESDIVCSYHIQVLALFIIICKCTFQDVWSNHVQKCTRSHMALKKFAYFYSRLVEDHRIIFGNIR